MLNYWQMAARSVPERGRPESLKDSRSQLLAMDALAEDDKSLLNKPDHQFFVQFDIRAVNNLHFYDPDLYPASSGPYHKIGSPQINGITNKLGPVPLLSQRHDMPEGQLCNSSALGDNCIGNWCECTHLLQVRLGEVVEMVLINNSTEFGYTHPIHLHGFSYRVVSMDRLQQIVSPKLFRQLDEAGLIERKLHLAPFKDTVALPNGGFVVIRFVADNPGVWFMHCHLVLHSETGMSLFLEVLDKDGKLPPAPREFPRCGSFELSKADFRQGKSLSSQKDTEHQSMDGHSILQNPEVPASEVPTPPRWAFLTMIGLGLAVIVLTVLVSILWRKNVGHGSYKWSKLPRHEN